MFITFQIALIASSVGLALFFRALRRPNADGSRRCPKCTYRAPEPAEPPCPECGYAWSSPDELYRTAFKRRQAMIAIPMLLAMPTYLVAQQVVFRGLWTQVLPRPILQARLESTPAAAVPPGGTLPRPQVQASFDDRWNHMRWSYRMLDTVDAYVALIEGWDGDIDKLDQIGSASLEIDLLFAVEGRLVPPVREFWFAPARLDSAQNRLGAIQSPDRSPLAAWASALLDNDPISREAAISNTRVPFALGQMMASSPSPGANRIAFMQWREYPLEQGLEILKSLEQSADQQIARAAASHRQFHTRSEN